MPARRIYLDYNATSPLDPRVLEAMRPWLEGKFGNPSSIHWAGREARAAVDRARGQVAKLLGAAPSEIVFTSGGTEADNLALRGVVRAARAIAPHLVVSAIEHPAVSEAAQALQEEGVALSRVGVGREGRIDPDRLEAALRPETLLVSVILAQNETGALQPVAEIARRSRERGILVHTDAVQAAGRLPLRVADLGVDLLSLSGHKIGAPQGVGALYVRRGVRLEPIHRGGGQERGRRSGTENVAGIVGLGAAAELAEAELGVVPARVQALRDRLERELCAAIPGLRVNSPGERLCNTLSLLIDAVEGEALLLALDLEGIAASSGSACSSGTMRPSPVLLAMGLTPEEAHGSLRLSLGRESRRGGGRGRSASDCGPPARLLPGGTPARARRPMNPEPLTPRDLAGARVAVAMSGGVDSSVAAALLREAGAEVVGLSLRLFDAPENQSPVRGSCCAPEDLHDARAVAQALGIAHYVLDATASFAQEVIDDFVSSYRSGRTPNPCVRCNERTKFRDLLHRARQLGCAALATGHYARVVRQGTRLALCRATDRRRDQSYFLFTLGQTELCEACFPVGEMTKEQVRAQARALGLPVGDKPDSMDVCFVGARRAFELVEERGGDLGAGDLVDLSGRLLGRHRGIHRYTVGQRHGLGLSGPEPYYVVEIDPRENRVVVGRSQDALARGCRLEDLRWAAGEPPARVRAVVQVRSRSPAQPAQVTIDKGHAEVLFERPVQAVSPGQAAVLYEDDRVLGGGWIAEAIR
jgi:cysteine desulfurase